MTWKKNTNGDYERSCQHCCGTGRETMLHRCLCPWEHCTIVDHPSNTENGQDRYGGIGHRMVRCDKCAMLWMTYYEIGDDSWDVPGPERLGVEMLADDWRPGVET